MTTIRVTRKKRPDPLQPWIDITRARLALKRAAGKREPVAAAFAVPRAYRALAASFRACAGTVGSVLSEVR